MTKMSRKEFLQQDPQVVSLPTSFARHIKPVLIAKCCKCNREISIAVGHYWRRRRQGPWACFDCIKPDLVKKSKNNKLYKDPKYRERFRKLHDDPTYRAKVHNETVKKKISESMKEAWQDEEKRSSHLKHRKTKKFRNKISNWSKSKWKDPTYIARQKEYKQSEEWKKKASEQAKKLWKNPEFRKKITDILDKARPKSAFKGQISSLQTILYSLLRDLNIKFYEEGPETIIGPIVTSNGRFKGYSFDCLVEHNGKKLFIEPGSEYYHGQDKEAADRSKATFLKNYFPEYDLLVLLDHDFRSPKRLKSIILEKLEIERPKPISFNFNDLVVEPAEVTTELKCLFSKYHYLANIGRYGSYRYAAKLDDKIVAAAVFSIPRREERLKEFGLKPGQLLELTRLCIHSSYQKKGFASWFMIKILNEIWKDRPNLKSIISYIDELSDLDSLTLQNIGWKVHRIFEPDYWYSDGRNWFHKEVIRHRKSSPDAAEPAYVKLHNLQKVMGRKKIRYLITKPL